MNKLKIKVWRADYLNKSTLGQALPTSILFPMQQRHYKHITKQEQETKIYHELEHLQSRKKKNDLSQYFLLSATAQKQH